MKAAFANAVDRLATAFEGFVEDLRDLKNDVAVDDEAGDGEYRDDDHLDRVEAPQDRPRYADNGMSDDKDVTLKSGTLRQLVDNYRKMSRYHREGRIMDQQERFKLHAAVKAVKHLIRHPR